MKKRFILWLVFILGVTVVRSQVVDHATISIDKVNISEVKQGEDVIVPIRLQEKSDALISGFQLFIEFDHSILSWKGSSENPQPGIIHLNNATPYNGNDWLFNDNSNQIVGIWIDPSFKGVDIRANEVIFEVVFSYKGGLLTGETSKLSWGRAFEQAEGLVVRGTTEMYSDDLKLFELKLVDGAILN